MKMLPSFLRSKNTKQLGLDTKRIFIVICKVKPPGWCHGPKGQLFGREINLITQIITSIHKQLGHITMTTLYTFSTMLLLIWYNRQHSFYSIKDATSVVQPFDVTELCVS